MDPWKHRSEGMKCKTCMWFVEKAATRPIPAEMNVGSEVTKFGRCRRHSPTMNGYPSVYGHDWCGDHKLDENKA